MTKNLVFIAIISSLLLFQAKATVNDLQSGTLLSSITFVDFLVDLSSIGADSKLNIKFIPNSPPKMTYTYIQCSFVSQPIGPRVPSNFYKTNPNSLNYMDLQAAWFGKDQYINLVVPTTPSVPSTLYVTAFNLDPSTDRFNINYILSTQSSNSYQCAPCLNGGSLISSSSCKCNCQDDYAGKDCSLEIHSMDRGQTFTDEVFQDEFQFFKFKKQYGRIQFKVTSLNKQELTIYFQYQSYSGEVAGYLNAYNSGLTVSYNLNGAKPYLSALDILSSSDLLMTITKTTPGKTSYSVNLSSSQETTTSVNILLIVLLILGALIGIVICAVVVFIIFKLINKSQPIIHAADAGQYQGLNNNLSSNQINMYFPQYVQSKLSFNHIEDSTLIEIKNQNQKKQKQKEENQRDCVICLCPVQPQEPARMTYCNHVFHSTCLINWFKKQRNCPYCRQEFNRQNTAKLYKQLVAANKNRVLQGDELVKAIIAKKLQKSKFNVQNIQ